MGFTADSSALKSRTKKSGKSSSKKNEQLKSSRTIDKKSSSLVRVIDEDEEFQPLGRKQEAISQELPSGLLFNDLIKQFKTH